MSAMPPPVHGFSVVSQLLLAEVERRAGPAFRKTVIDRSTSSFGRKSWLRSLIRQIGRACLALLRPGDRVLYLGLSGGRGQALDLIFVLLSRLLLARIFIHHHSFAYINARKPVSRVLFFIAGRAAKHIVLCRCMQDRLGEQYHINPDSFFVVSNAAFLPPARQHSNGSLRANEPPSLTSGSMATIGFISNITKEKGIFVFLELASRLISARRIGRVVIAGPVAPDVRDSFDRVLADCPWISFLGPVYGTSKDSFFHQIDFLVFPTLYANEAEPLVMLEALQQGVSVIAFSRGCITEVVGDENSTDAFEVGSLQRVVEHALSSFEGAGEKDLHRRANALLRFNKLQRDGLESFSALICEMLDNQVSMN